MGNLEPSPTQSTTHEEVGKEITTQTTSSKKGWINYFVEKAGNLWMDKEDKKAWLKDMRGNLSLIATVISTMTFQMAFNPPGGVRPIKDDSNPSVANNAYAYPPDTNNAYPPDANDGYPNAQICMLNRNTSLCPGEAVLAVVYPDDYFRFLVSNTICFVASLSILLLLVSGIRLHHRLPMWMLSIGMCVTLTSLALSYIIALEMHTPEPVFSKASKFLEKLVFTWIGLLSLLGLCFTLRGVIWGVKFFLKRSKMAMTQNMTKEISVC